MLYGNIKGIKKTVCDRLENLIGEYDRTEFIDKGVLETICEITTKINREICVYITRGGRLIAVGVGDATTVALEDVNFKRGDTRFSGVRCVHTHPNGVGRLSDMDLSALESLRLDAMSAVAVRNGKAYDIETAIIRGKGIDKLYFKWASKIDDKAVFDKILENEKLSVKDREDESGKMQKNTAILVGVSEAGGEQELAELERLADTMGLVTVEKVHQRQRPDRVTCVGSGKVTELARLVQTTKAEYVVFNNQLTGSQLIALEDALNAKVIDRSMLILEIFAKHATTNEGKLQVKLALAQYTLPKLLGQGKELSRIGGGAGTATKGAGETKLETDRRKIRRTIFELQQKIEQLKKDRDVRRDRRLKNGLKTVALVGYTNSGKSTLMNTISRAGVLEADKLFATLDPVTRRVYENGREYLLTDTVGFIDNLPHEFIDAFRSTLEEAVYADVLLDVCDCSSPELVRQRETVKRVLQSLGVTDTPVITVFNKADLAPDFTTDESDAVIISAKNGEGVDILKEKIGKVLFQADS